MTSYVLLCAFFGFRVQGVHYCRFQRASDVVVAVAVVVCYECRAFVNMARETASGEEAASGEEVSSEVDDSIFFGLTLWLRTHSGVHRLVMNVRSHSVCCSMQRALTLRNDPYHACTSTFSVHAYIGSQDQHVAATHANTDAHMHGLRMIDLCVCVRVYTIRC